jgi:phage gpG-like protein
MPTQRRGRDTRIKLVGGEITFSVGDPQMITMTRTLDHYRTSTRNFAPVYEQFATYHRRSIQRNFAAEGRPVRWARLTEGTIKDRIRQGFGRGPILVRSGRLKRGFRFEWGPRSYRVWNRTPYFNAHQYGYPPNNLPRRAMLTLLTQDKAQFTRLAREHLSGDDQ